MQENDFREHLVREVINMPNIVLNKVTIATNNTEQMVAFYHEFFDVDFAVFEAMGVTLYEGRLGAVTFMFCPNELLKIKAEKNNVQLTLVVPDLQKILDSVDLYGGKILQQAAAQGSYLAAGITDPDGNSIELMQVIEPER